jgi:hypothetical protein
VKKLLVVAAVMLGFCLAVGGTAKADDIHLCATAAACTGNPNNVQFVSGGTTTAFVYGKFTSPTPDTLFILVLTPVANNSGAWNSGTNLWNVLGESPAATFNVTQPNLNAAIEQLGFAGFSAQSFNVQDFQVRINWTGALDTSPISFTLPGTPAAGDMYMAFLENGTDPNDVVTASSPWSSSLVNVPEPSSLVLLGVGLLGLVCLGGRKLISA